MESGEQEGKKHPEKQGWKKEADLLGEEALAAPASSAGAVTDAGGAHGALGGFTSAHSKAGGTAWECQ